MELSGASSVGIRGCRIDGPMSSGIVLRSGGEPIDRVVLQESILTNADVGLKIEQPVRK